MADTKISALTAGAPALGTDQLPAARSGTNVKLLVSDLATFIRTNNVLSQTLAQAQSNNGTYTKGSWVQVTEDIGGITGSADTIFPVIVGGVLAGTGWCATFQNTGMAAERIVEIDWDVTADFISRIKEPKQNNTVTAHYSSVGLENFPFDTTTIKQTTIIDPFVCAIDVAAQVYAATFEGNNSIIIEAGATFSGKAGREAVVALSDTSFFTGEVGANGGVTLFGTQALNWCKIGANKNVDCSSIDSGYGQTGKVYDGDYSTFECSVLIDLNALTELNITQVNATEDYSFCGRFLNVQNSGGAVDIESIISNQTGHEILFILGHSDAISFSTGSGLQTKNSATINLTTLGSTFGVMYNDVISKFMENGNTLII